MNWISVKDRLPGKHRITEVMVVNIKHGMNIFKAMYHHDLDVFVLHHPSIRESIVLDVTHWIEIPELPKEKQ